MANKRTTRHNYLDILLIPLWVGLLVLPFSGIGSALRLFAAAVIAMLLWRMLRADLVTTARASAAEKLSKAAAALLPITRYASTPLTYVLIVVFVIILPLFLNDYYRDIMTLTGMYVVLALGLNIVVGQAGLLNLGYVAFYAIGAYTYAILSTTYGLPFWPGLVAGGSVAALFAVLLGMPTLRLRGDYFAIVTLGLGEITRIILNNWDSMTGGPNGISKIGRPVIAGYELHTTLDFYYLIIVMVIITIFAMHRLIASRIGRAWVAIREDEVAAEAMGVNTYRMKLLAFVLGRGQGSGSGRHLLKGRA
jgi:branched-chain amino acid transport system permease protein